MRITKEDIKERFKAYNQRYFDSALPACKCHIFKGNSFVGRYNYSYNSKGTIVGHIWIAYNVDWDEESLQDIIVHEMTHHYVQAIEGHQGGLFGHNWRFRRKQKKIVKEHGIVIHTHYHHLFLIGEKKPTTHFQKFRRRWGL